MERQLGKPLHIQAAEAFESPAFLQKLGMARADAERIFGGADWHQLLRDLVPIRGRISCADALAAFRPLLDQVAPDPAEGWLSYAYQVARALLYPASDPGHTSAQWDGALCFLQLLQVLFDAERTCLPLTSGWTLNSARRRNSPTAVWRRSTAASATGSGRNTSMRCSA